MKLLIASDIHGSAYYCRLLIDRINEEKPDKILLLGDILYHGPRNDLPKDYAPKEVIAMLNPLKDMLLCVRGNCDTEVDQMVLDFPVLSDSCLLYIDGATLFATHGHIFNNDALPPISQGTYLLNGHFHVPKFKAFENYTYVNCGSVSIPKENSPHSYVIFENSNFTFKDVETAKEYTPKYE